VRDHKKINSLIVPSTTTHRPNLPNFFFEVKGTDGLWSEALAQASHDGAIDARAVQSLQSYGEEQPVYRNSTLAISSTYYAGMLRFYGHSVAQSGGPGTDPEYYMHLIKGYNMDNDQETFIRGATMFKNALDMTKGRRDAAIARANEIAARSIEDENGEDEDEEEPISEQGRGRRSR
jgi:hypothetical protein